MLVFVLGAIVGGYGARRELQSLSNRDLGTIVIRRVAAQTGLALVPAAISTHFSYHLIVTFEHPRLMRGNSEVCHFRAISLVFGYRTLLLHNGLPLLSMTFEQPAIPWSDGGGFVPLLDARAVARTRIAMRVLAGLTRRIVIHDGELLAADGRPLLDRVTIDASRRYPSASPWEVSAGWHFPPGGLPEFSVGVQVLMTTQDSNRPLARGSIWWEGARLSNLEVGGADLRGRLRGDGTLTIAHDGELSGGVLLRLPHLVVNDARLDGPAEIDDLRGEVSFMATPAAITVPSFDLATGSSGRLLEGAVRIDQPMSADPNFRLRLSVRRIDAATLKAVTARINGLPRWVTYGARLVAAGSLTIDQLAFSSDWSYVKTTPVLDWYHDLDAQASIQGLALQPPEQPPIPDNQLDAAIVYSKGMLQFTQAQARLGQSSLNDVSIHANLTHGLRRVPYSVAMRGDFDFGELDELAHRLLPDSFIARTAAVKSISGRAHATFEARGELADLAPRLPAEYAISVRPYAITAQLAALPGRYEVVGGSISVRPDAIDVDRMDVVPPRGRLTVSGALAIDRDGHVTLREAALELHQVSAEDWMPHIIDPHDVAVEGSVGGDLLIKRALRGAGVRVSGTLTVGPGQVVFSFLRSPVIIVNSASATFANNGLTLRMPGSRLDGAALDLDMSVPDLDHPVVTINAVAQRLNIEAITAVRMPWSPPAPPSTDHTSYRGRVIAREAHLGPLQMKDLQVEFDRGPEHWVVAPLTAQALGGRVAVAIHGQHIGDWVDLDIDLHDVDMAQLQALGSSDAVISGRLNSHCSLNGDTDGDFFQTLYGKVSIDAHDGVLNRMKLLSRMLSLVDVSQWLNAHIADPRVKGLPFKTITATFDGTGGTFHTSDFALDGPVMMINALGNIDLSSETLNFQASMRPFQLLDTVFTKIPLIGERLAESQSRIVAAYFNIYGSLDNPTVRPAPITSISKILIHTLGFPINFIRPNTIR